MKLRVLALSMAALLFGGLAVAAVENVAVINGYPPITVDPAVASDWYDTEAMYNLYSPLVYPAPEGGARAHLATDWEPVDGDLTHWRFTLRQGVKFHSGYEMTAEELKQQRKRNKKTTCKSQARGVRHLKTRKIGKTPKRLSRNKYALCH